MLQSGIRKRVTKTVTLAVAGALLCATAAPSFASSRNFGKGLVVLGGVIGGALLLSLPSLHGSGASAQASEPQPASPAQANNAAPAPRCWIGTNDRGNGYWEPC